MRRDSRWWHLHLGRPASCRPWNQARRTDPALPPRGPQKASAQAWDQEPVHARAASSAHCRPSEILGRPAPSAERRRIGRAVTYEEASSLPSACAMTHVGITAPRPALCSGWNPTHICWSAVFAVLSEESTFRRAMAVTMSAATLPAVVEELLSEMEAAVRESARSTGRKECVTVLWAVDHAPPVREARGGGLWTRGALDSGLRPRALRPELPVLFPRVFYLQTLLFVCLFLNERKEKS